MSPGTTKRIKSRGYVEGFARILHECCYRYDMGIPEWNTKSRYVSRESEKRIKICMSVVIDTTWGIRNGIRKVVISPGTTKRIKICISVVVDTTWGFRSRIRKVVISPGTTKRIKICMSVVVDTTWDSGTDYEELLYPPGIRKRIKICMSVVVDTTWGIRNGIRRVVTSTGKHKTYQNLH